jgi:hypothetical protein
LVGCIVLLGATIAPMKPNTALGAAALGLALSVSQLRQAARLVSLLSLLGALLATAIGGITLAEHLFGFEGIDQLLFTDDADRTAPFPGRPPALSALLLLLLGMGLLCPPQTRGWRHVRTFCALASLLVTWTLLNGYLFGRNEPPGALPLGSVAVHTSVGMCLLALGLLASQPGSWPIHTICADGIGGTICRWLLPPALLAPPLLGWLLTDAALLSEPHAAFRWALYSVFSSAGSAGLILALARRIELLDAERSVATMMSRSDPLTGLAKSPCVRYFPVGSLQSGASSRARVDAVGYRHRFLQEVQRYVRPPCRGRGVEGGGGDVQQCCPRDGPRGAHRR